MLKSAGLTLTVVLALGLDACAQGEDPGVAATDVEQREGVFSDEEGAVAREGGYVIPEEELESAGPGFDGARVATEKQPERR